MIWAWGMSSTSYYTWNTSARWSHKLDEEHNATKRSHARLKDKLRHTLQGMVLLTQSTDRDHIGLFNSVDANQFI